MCASLGGCLLVVTANAHRLLIYSPLTPPLLSHSGGSPNISKTPMFKACIKGTLAKAEMGFCLDFNIPTINFH